MKANSKQPTTIVCVYEWLIRNAGRAELLMAVPDFWLRRPGFFAALPR
jgi:hypothetical protein